MYAQLRALAWEYWRTGWTGFAVGLAAMIGIPGLMYAVMVYAAGVDPGRHRGDAVGISFACIVGLLPICLAEFLPSKKCHTKWHTLGA